MPWVLRIAIGCALMWQTGLVCAEEPMGSVSREMKQLEKATFAGGCFWCMEHPFDDVAGVTSTTVGYTGGSEENPTYVQVSSGRTGHAEAIEVIYDGTKITYAKLLDVFWRNIDPTDPNGQFTDRGMQYRTAIFYHDENQKHIATASKEKLEQSGRFDKPIATEITPASAFYPAEDYHQEYYKTHPIRYKIYKRGSGRDQYINSTWGKAAH